MRFVIGSEGREASEPGPLQWRSHAHGDIRYRCHIHRATAEAISTGRKVDSHAEATDRYRTLEGALACLIKDCGVQGLTAQPDERDLFDGP